LITRDLDAPRVTLASFVKPVLGWSAGPQSLVAVINEIIHKEKLDKAVIGLEMGPAIETGVFSAYEYLELKGKWPAIKFTNVLSIATKMQLVKEPCEIELLRRAAESAEVGMKYAYEAMSVGMTEIELAGYAEFGMRKGGTMYNWCMTGNEVGSGYNQSLPGCLTSIAGHKHIQYGDIVTIDIHSMYDLYISDFALNAIIGVPTPKQIQLAGTWKTIAEYVATLLKPGAVCSEVAEAVIRKSRELEVEDKLIKYFGHGLGLDASMPPYIRQDVDFVMEEDMCLVEVVQLTEPGVGGMRLEMPCAITAHGCEFLCKTPIDLHIKDF
jgi:Xaa-Pro aminopeptidase